MELSRRELSLLLLAAANSSAQPLTLPSKAYTYGELPVKTSGTNETRAVLNGTTHSGYPVELHTTTLGPHAEPHPGHHHVHEEIVLVRTGSLQVTLAGRSAVYGPGAVVYVASGEEHGWKNAGTVPAEYFVIALGAEKAA